MAMYLNNYEWDGSLNGSNFQGSGHTITNTDTGIIIGSAMLNGVPNNYPIKITGASLYCISCSNSLGGGATAIPVGLRTASILSLTGGSYTTARKITHIFKSSKIGETVIEGRVKQTGDDTLSIKATVKAQYDGPESIDKISDYVLPTRISAGQIDGSYVQYLSILGSDDFIVNFVEATYRWDGASRSAVAAPLPEQSLGIYFREVSEIGFSSGSRSIQIKAIGNNIPPTHQLTPSSFISI